MLAILSSLSLSAQDAVFPKLNPFPYLVGLTSSPCLPPVTVFQFYVSHCVSNGILLPSSFFTTCPGFYLLGSPYLHVLLLFCKDVLFFTLNSSVNDLRGNCSFVANQYKSIPLKFLSNPIISSSVYLLLLTFFLLSAVFCHILPVCQRQIALKELPQAIHGLF